MEILKKETSNVRVFYENEMVALCLKYNITPSQAKVLPAMIEKISKFMKMRIIVVLTMAMKNPELGEFIVKTCKRVSEDYELEMSGVEKIA